MAILLDLEDNRPVIGERISQRSLIHPAKGRFDG